MMFMHFPIHQMGMLRLMPKFIVCYNCWKRLATVGVLSTKLIPKIHRKKGLTTATKSHGPQLNLIIRLFQKVTQCQPLLTLDGWGYFDWMRVGCDYYFGKRRRWCLYGKRNSVKCALFVFVSNFEVFCKKEL